MCCFYNVAIGFCAAREAHGANNGIFIGCGAGKCNCGSYNISVGDCAMMGSSTVSNNSGDYNIVFGACAGQAMTTGGKNILIGGKQNGRCMTTGQNNILMGNFTGKNITTGKYNVAFGEEAMLGSTMTGDHNTAIGKASAYNLTSGDNNIAFGHYALNKNKAGCNNVAIGQYALQSRCCGHHNIAIGMYALQGHATGAAESNGCCNIFMGHYSGKNVCSGNNNIGIGIKAGCDIETGSMNIMIGCHVDGSGAGVDKEIVIGYDSSGVAKGTRTFYVQSDMGVFHAGNTSTWSTVSDLRIKKNVTDNNTGLDKIKDIQVRNFEYRTKDEITDFENPDAVVVNEEGLQLGVIAQEIQQVLPDTIIQQSTGALSVNTDNLLWYLINAVKELSAKNDALEERIKNLEGS
tara:strand:- start:694 stop:1908 length:1215 start_codon:yes stop_codon:yes gene_type:complete